MLDDLGQQQYQKRARNFASISHDGRLDERFVEMEVQDNAFPMIEEWCRALALKMWASMSRDMLGNLFPTAQKAPQSQSP